jgi:hypothetical protein
MSKVMLNNGNGHFLTANELFIPGISSAYCELGVHHLAKNRIQNP